MVDSRIFGRYYLSNLLCDGTERHSAPTHFVNRINPPIEIPHDSPVTVKLEHIETQRHTSDTTTNTPDSSFLLCSNICAEIICGSKGQVERVLGIISQNRNHSETTAKALPGRHCEIEVYLKEMNLSPKQITEDVITGVSLIIRLEK